MTGLLSNALAASVADTARQLEADVNRGYKDLVCRTKSGEEHVVRLVPPPKSFRVRICQRYEASNDLRDLIRPMVERRFSTDEFLNSLLPADMGKLGTAAGALLLGPELLKQVLSGRFGG
jgi:hypothetical protein